MTRVLLLRSVGLWFGIHILVMVVSIGFAFGIPHRSSIAPMVVVAVGALGWRSTINSNGHRFLANLGVSPVIAILYMMAPAVVLEILFVMLPLS